MTAREMARLYPAVALGSVAGALLRLFASQMLASTAGTGFPWGTLFVNVAGSFLIGLYAAISAPHGRIPGTLMQRNFVMTGFCGGFTTFSAFSLETLRLAQSGDLVRAGIYVGASLVVWLAAAALGFLSGAELNRTKVD